MAEVVDVKRPRNYGSLAIKSILALAASGATIFWAFHDVDLDEVGMRLKDSDWGILFLTLVVQTSIHFIRVARWGLLVRPLAPVSYRAIFAACSVGFPATFFLPFRLGEFVRPIMISRLGVPFAGAMASVVVERVADGIVNLGLFFLFLTLLPESAPVPDELRTFSMIALVLFGGAFVVLIFACLAHRTALAILTRLLTPISKNLATKVVGLLDTFIEGVNVLRSPSRVFGFVSLSLLFWGINGLITWVVANSYNPGLIILAGPFTISVVVFAIMIPAAPGFLGTLESGFRLGLAPFGVTPGVAAVIALAFHAVQFIMMGGLALAGFAAAEGKQREKVTASPSHEAENVSE